MLSNIALLRAAGELAAHSARRHETIATNIANADTPGFKAMDLKPVFNDFFTSQSDLKATRSTHFIASSANPSTNETIVQNGPVSANGNSVTLEHEMVKMTENRQAHDLALSVYKSSIGVLRTSLGRG